MASNELDIIVRLKNLFSKESAKVDKSITKIGKDSAKAAKGVDKLDKETNSFGKNLKKLAIGGALFAIGKGLFNIGKAVVGAAAELETIGVQFEVLTGSAEKATEVLKDLSDFSASTPFQFTDIAKAGKQLIAFGIETDEVKDRLQEIGDVAAATGADFGEVTTVFGQVQAAGKLTGERLLQLQERAIPIGPALAKTLGVAESAVKGLVSEGKVTTEVFNEAFATLSGEGGVAFGGMSKLSQTLAGKVSTLKDNFQILSAELGTLLLPALKKGVDILTNFAQGVTRVVKDLNSLRDANVQAANATEEQAVASADTLAILQGVTREMAKVGAGTKDAAAGIEEINYLLGALEETGVENLPSQIGSEEDFAMLQERLASVVELNQGLLDATILTGEEEVAANAEKNALLLEQETAKQEGIAAIKAEYKALEMELAATEDEEKIAKIEAEMAMLALTEAQKAQIKKAVADQETKDLEKKYRKEGKLFEAFLLKKGVMNAKQAQDFVKWEDFMANAKNSKNKEVAAIGKAIAIKDIGVKTAQAAMSAFSSMAAIPVVGSALGFVAAAAAIAFGAEQISAVNSGGSFASGGIIPGSSFAGDNVKANVNSGEMILNGDQQEELFDMAQGGGSGGDMAVNVNIDGNVVMASVVKNYNEAKKSGILEVDFQ